jgi:hypothetical protein
MILFFIYFKVPFINKNLLCSSVVALVIRDEMIGSDGWHEGTTF